MGAIASEVLKNVVVEAFSGDTWSFRFVVENGLGAWDHYFTVVSGVFPSAVAGVIRIVGQVFASSAVFARA